MPIKCLKNLLQTENERWDGAMASNCILLVMIQKKYFFCLTGADVDDKNGIVWNVLAKNLYGKLFADRGCTHKIFSNLDS